MERYITWNTGSELFCFVVGLICLIKDKEPAWRLLLLFMFITCVVEFGGIYIRLEWHKPNAFIYNIYLIAECLFQSYFFYYIYKTWVDRRGVMLVWFVLFFASFFYELSKSDFKYYASDTTTIMSVVLTLASVYYYYLILRDDRYRRLATDPIFWWVNGVICFYFAGIANAIFFRYLVKIPGTDINLTARYVVITILNVILYLIWSYSFLCRYRQRNSTPLSS